MDGRTLLIVLLITILIIAIVAAVVADAIRRKDFRDQVSGKKPERKLDDAAKISYDQPHAQDQRMEMDKEVLRSKNASNIRF